MEGCKFGWILAVLATAIATVAAEMSVRMEALPPMVKVGGQVDLICHTEDLVPNWISWYKETPSGEIKFAVNFGKENDFKKVSRYEMSYTREGDNKLAFHFQIENAQVEDSGNYTCRIERQPNLFSKTELIVQVEPKSMSFVYTDKTGKKHNSEKESILELEADEPQELKCVVRGGYPAPTVQITLEGHGLAHDLTDQFQRTEAMKRVPTEVDGLDKLSVSVTLQTDRLVMGHDFNGKQLYCSVKMPGSGVIPIQDEQFEIKMKGFKPIFKNCTAELLTILGEKNVNMSCEVTAQPAIHEFKWYWFRHPANLDVHDEPPKQEMIAKNNKASLGHYVGEVLQVDEHSSLMVLRIPKVSEQMFRSHYFVARNEYGEATYSVNLTKDHNRSENMSSPCEPGEPDCLRLSVCAAEFSVNVDLSKTEANIGDDLTVTCKVTNDKKETFFIVWMKRIGDTEEEIGTNDHLNPAFRKSGRFTATYSVLKPGDLSKVTFTLSITGLQASESGQIGCKLPRQNVEVFKPFTVFVPIKTIRLTSQHLNGTHAQSYVDDQKVTFDEGETQRFYCYVNGSYPKPDVNILVGDKDITHLFDEEARLIQDGPDNGLKNISYDVVLANQAFDIKYSYSGKTLKCLASVPNSEFSGESIGIKIKLAGYKPKFMCNRTVLMRMHDKDVNISCKVRADPPVTDAHFQWNLPKSGHNETLLPGVMKGHYRGDLVKGDNKFESYMILRIDRVFPQHMRKYFFVAENELGQEVHEIHLEKDPSQELSGSPAQGVSVVMFVLLLALPWV